MTAVEDRRQSAPSRQRLDQDVVSTRFLEISLHAGSAARLWQGSLQLVVDDMAADFMVERVDDLVVPVPSKMQQGQANLGSAQDVPARVC